MKLTVAAHAATVRALETAHGEAERAYARALITDNDRLAYTYAEEISAITQAIRALTTASTGEGE